MSLNATNGESPWFGCLTAICLAAIWVTILSSRPAVRNALKKDAALVNDGIGCFPSCKNNKFVATQGKQRVGFVRIAGMHVAGFPGWCFPWTHRRVSNKQWPSRIQRVKSPLSLRRRDQWRARWVAKRAGNRLTYDQCMIVVLDMIARGIFGLRPTPRCDRCFLPTRIPSFEIHRRSSRPSRPIGSRSCHPIARRITSMTDDDPRNFAVERGMVRRMHGRCNRPRHNATQGTATLGSSRARMPAGRAHKRNRRQEREPVGKKTARTWRRPATRDRSGSSCLAVSDRRQDPCGQE